MGTLWKVALHECVHIEENRANYCLSSCSIVHSEYRGDDGGVDDAVCHYCNDGISCAILDKLREVTRRQLRLLSIV